MKKAKFMKLLKQVPRFTKHLDVICVSQVNIIVQPLSAECYEFPAAMYIQAKNLAVIHKLPVIFLDKHDNAATIQP